jgi:hypothetical protein
MPEENREFLWKLTLVERVKGHPGFKGVDKTSILNTTFVEEKEIDVVIWDGPFMNKESRRQQIGLVRS